MLSQVNVPTSLQVEVVSPLTSNPANARAKLDQGAGYVHGEIASNQLVRHVVDIDSEQLATGVANISAVIGRAMERVSPDAWSVEFNVGFKAGVKMPILLSGEANAALKVTLSWKKPDLATREG